MFTRLLKNNRCLITLSNPNVSCWLSVYQQLQWFSTVIYNFMLRMGNMWLLGSSWLHLPSSVTIGYAEQECWDLQSNNCRGLYFPHLSVIPVFWGLYSYYLQDLSVQMVRIGNSVGKICKITSCWKSISNISFSNAINLLSNIPVSCLDVLISPSTQENTEETDIKYNGMNMDAVQVLLKFMEKRIDKVWVLYIGSTLNVTW